MEARYVPFNYCLRWILCSIKIAERFYSLFLGAGFLFLMSTLAVSIIPFFGGLAAACLTFLYLLGAMRLVKQIRDTGNATFDDFLKYVFDPIVFQRFVPFLVILIVVAGAAFAAQFTKMTLVIFPLSGLANILEAFFSFSAFMMLQNPGMTWQTALSSVAKAIWQNIVTWLCHGLLLILFAVGCMVLCFLPFFFYFIPMTLPGLYLVYASFFEGLDIDTTIAEWSSKARVAQTVVLTSDAPSDGV